MPVLPVSQQVLELCAILKSQPAGQSHLINPIQNVEEVVMIPTGLETFGLNANTG